jgi:thioredoxin 1
LDIEMVGDSEWEDRVLGADRPVMVEFWSPNCNVCRTMEPRLRRVVGDYRSRVTFFRVDVTREEDLVWAYEVVSTPTFIAYADSEPVGALYGEVDPTELANLLDDALEGK